jgi:thiamine phosphate synthase YjbQ (UPF0047 family)
MQQAAQDLTVSTGGEVEIVDLTDDVARIVDGAGVRLPAPAR